MITVAGSCHIVSEWTVQETRLPAAIALLSVCLLGHHVKAAEKLPSNARAPIAVPYQRLSSQFWLSTDMPQYLLRCTVHCRRYM
jgi:hypothetical protein